MPVSRCTYLASEFDVHINVFQIIKQEVVGDLIISDNVSWRSCNRPPDVSTLHIYAEPVRYKSAQSKGMPSYSSSFPFLVTMALSNLRFQMQQPQLIAKCPKRNFRWVLRVFSQHPQSRPQPNPPPLRHSPSAARMTCATTGFPCARYMLLLAVPFALTTSNCTALSHVANISYRAPSTLAPRLPTLLVSLLWRRKAERLSAELGSPLL